MKIYFAASIRGGREDQSIYASLVKELQRFGEVLTEHVSDANLKSSGEENDKDQHIYNRDMDWLSQSDILVAEVTTPSLGVGYEIAKAEQLEKPVFCLFRANEKYKLSAMITGNPIFRLIKYDNLEDLKRKLEEALKGF